MVVLTQDQPLGWKVIKRWGPLSILEVQTFFQVVRLTIYNKKQTFYRGGEGGSKVVLELRSGWKNLVQKLL